jgi:ubiquinone/menaquinone biosynthesis C-methylase UbiE
MTEMGTVARFFVNLRSGRASRRRFQWVRANLRFPGRPSCLEIGCGNGDFAAKIVGELQPAQYVATDLDPRQLEVARRHLIRLYPAGIPATLRLQLADMTALPFPEAAFDVVFAFFVLHHASPERHDFTKVPQALAEVDRVLRPGGSFAYEEFLHTEGIRAWLTEHRYSLAAIRHGWKREIVLAIKASESAQPTNPSA